ncbi:MAG TPA: diaminopimelate epimerase [Gemmatimonadaceae bacterium]|nr:diaminopimelate epimerase [Gemmatimonadaceae bacterium]
MIPSGRPFYKMSGSGNDFVMIDARAESRGSLAEPSVIQRVCARGTGVGADGIVFLEPSSVADVRLTYLNADGSPADFCGNATLCTTRLATELGMADPAALSIETDSGVVAARIHDGLPEIDLPKVADVEADLSGEIPPEAGERRLGYAMVGVPHLVIRCNDVSTVDVVGRGRPLRSHPAMKDHGANVNFVSHESDGRWRYRTYERGVEAETLACGSGAVATAILLTVWGEAVRDRPVEIETRSGKLLRVTLTESLGGWVPSLAGEGRVVFEGMLAEV